MYNITSDIKAAHQTLMNSYVYVLQQNKDLQKFAYKPCSVFKEYLLSNINDIHTSLIERLTIPVLSRFCSLIIEIIVFPFLFIWSLELWIISVIIAKIPGINNLSLFLTIQTIKLHILAKVNELEKFYKYASVNNERDIWLLKAIQDCNYISSINKLNNIIFIFNILRNIVIAALGILKGLLGFIEENQPLYLVILTSICFILIVFLILFPFVCKRQWFIKNDVYSSEENLFRILETSSLGEIENKKEFQLDFLIHILNFLSRYTLVLALIGEFSKEDAFWFTIAVISFTTLFTTRKLR